MRLSFVAIRTDLDAVDAVLSDNSVPEGIIQVGDEDFSSGAESSPNDRHIRFREVRQRLDGRMLPVTNPAKVVLPFFIANAALNRRKIEDRDVWRRLLSQPKIQGVD